MKTVILWRRIDQNLFIFYEFILPKITTELVLEKLSNFREWFIVESYPTWSAYFEEITNAFSGSFLDLDDQVICVIRIISFTLCLSINLWNIRTRGWKVNLDDAKTYGFYAVNAHECHLGVKIRTFRCVFEICFACENCLDGFYIKIVCCFFNFTLESMATSKLGASQRAYYE